MDVEAIELLAQSHGLATLETSQLPLDTADIWVSTASKAAALRVTQLIGNDTPRQTMWIILNRITAEDQRLAARTPTYSSGECTHKYGAPMH